MRTVVPSDARLVPDYAKLAFKGEIYQVYQWPQKMFDGSIKTFEMLKRPDTVKVLAVRGDKIVAIIDEQPTLQPRLTLPGGRHDIDTETELQCAKRELLEETGMEFKTWKLLHAEQPQKKIEQIVYLYLATNFVKQGEPQPDNGEKITIKEIDFTQAKRMAQAGDNKYWPNEVLRRVNSLQELIALPEYRP